MVNYILNQAQRDQHRRARRLGKLTPRQQMQRQEFIKWAKPHGKTIGGILTAKGNTFMDDLSQHLRAWRPLTDKQLAAAIKVMGHVADTKRLNESSEHVGSVKQRLEFDAVVVGVYESEGYYGHTDIVKMRDLDGNMLTWFASGYTDLKRSDHINIRGTVKRHDEFRGIKNTILTRCKYDKYEIVDPNNLDQEIVL